MSNLISLQRSVIPACDVSSLNKLREMVEATCSLPGIGGYKVGLELIIPFGIRRVMAEMQMLWANSSLPVIYDHQKGGTDIPDLGPKFASALAGAGVDAAILFPFGGAATERAWIQACQDVGLTVLVGAEMTQKEFFEEEGGFIAQSAPGKIFEIAASMGVTDFVVPGNKTHKVESYRKLLEASVGVNNLTLYAPGFVSQGGDITETGQVAGDNWHAIVGSAIYNKDGVDAMRATAIQLTEQLLAVT